VSVNAFDKENILFQIPLRRALFERIASHIETQHRLVDGLFRISGAHTTLVALYCTFSHANVAAIPLESCTPHVVCGALKLWLRENPLITTHVRRNVLNAVRQIRISEPELLTREVVTSSSSSSSSAAASASPDSAVFAQLRDALSLLGADESAILQRLVLLLRRVSEKSASNRMGPRNLAIVFAPNLMRALDPASAVVESELEIDAIEIFIRCSDQLYREPYVPVAVAAPPAAGTAANDDAAPLAAFPCRWMKRNGKVEIFETSLVHVSNKLLKSKRARIFLNDVVDVACSVADTSSPLKSASSSASDSHLLSDRSSGGSVPTTLSGRANRSGLLHEVRSRAGVVGKFVARLTLRQGAVVTTVVTSGPQRDVNREVADFVLLVFDSQVSMKEAAALLERLRREPWRAAVSPRRLRTRASQQQLLNDESTIDEEIDKATARNSLRVVSGDSARTAASADTSSSSSPTAWLDVRSRSPPARRAKLQRSSAATRKSPSEVDVAPTSAASTPSPASEKRSALTKQIASIDTALKTMAGGGGGLTAVLQRQRAQLETELHALDGQAPARTASTSPPPLTLPVPPAAAHKKKKKRGSNSAKISTAAADDESADSESAST
jgi:hypothetical protein